MSKAEDRYLDYFQDGRVRNCSSKEAFLYGYKQAEKDICEWLEENAVNFVGLADNEHPAIGDTKAFYGTKSLIHYLKQAMKDE